MNFSSAQQADDFVARLLQLQAALHHAGMILRHLDRILVAKKVRRMQHVNVKRVAFDPFATIDQPAQRPELAVNCNSEGILDRVDGTHLVCDWADSTNPGGDIRKFSEIATAQE